MPPFLAPSLSAALVAVSAAARLERIAVLGESPPSQAVGLLGDLALGVLLALLGTPPPRAPAARVRVGAAVLLASLAAFAALAGQQYALHTGHRLSASIVAYALPRLSDLSAIVATGADALLGVHLALFLLTAGVAARLRPRPRPARRRWRLAGATAALSVLLGTWAAGTPPLAAESLPRPAAAREDPQAPWQPLAYRAPTRTERSPRAPAPDIVIYLLESTRRDLLAPYGGSAAAKVTPYLSGLAEAAVVVDRAYAVVPHTSKALVALLCGIPPHPATEIVEPRRLSAPCLPRLLEAAGYRTAFFQSAHGAFEDRRTLAARMGFATIVTQEDLDHGRFAPVGYVAMDERALVEPVLSFARRARDGGTPFLAVILSSVPHHPYESPDPLPPGVRQGSEVAYAAAVHHVDAAFGRIDRTLVDGSRGRPLVRIFVADHGEAFGEHGLRQHDTVPYDEVLRVPWLLLGPQSLVGPPRTVEGLRSQLDLVPTVLDLAGVETDGRFPGRSILDGDGHPRLAAWCWFEGTCVAALAAGPTKWVGFENGDAARFDLATDPLEEHPIPLPPSEARRLAGRIAAVQSLAASLYAPRDLPPPAVGPPTAAKPPPPQCMAACVADVAPDRPGLQVSCTAELVDRRGRRVPVPPCPARGTGGADHCFTPLTDEDLPDHCARRGYNMAVRFRHARRPPPGAVFDLRCKLAQDPAACSPGPPRPTKPPAGVSG